VIPGSPAAPAHANLKNDLTAVVETLLVNNSSYTPGVDEWVEWKVANDFLSADGVELLSTDGVDQVCIEAGSGNDKLVVEELAGAVEATIDYDRVTLVAGQEVLESGPVTTLPEYRNLIGFYDLIAGTNMYPEDGFTLSTSSTFVRDDTISASAGAAEPDDVFTLELENGGGFTVYSLCLAVDPDSGEENP